MSFPSEEEDIYGCKTYGDETILYIFKELVYNKNNNYQDKMKLSIFKIQDG